MTIAELQQCAQMHVQCSQWSEAERVYRQILQAEPDSAETWFRLGDVCQEGGKRDEAVACYQQSLSLDAGDARRIARLGALLLEQGGMAAVMAGLGDWAPLFVHMAHEVARRLPAHSVHVPLLAQTAPGELLDKISILEIKNERLADERKRKNVQVELESLSQVRGQLPASSELDRLTRELKAVNESLWQIEDEIRECERAQDFGPQFIELARSVYHQNDKRSAIKRQINEALGSIIMEEKSYAPYTRATRATPER